MHDGKEMMKKSVLFLFFYLFTVLPLSAKVIKVLTIGNSFAQDAVEQYLYELAKAQGDSLVIGNAYIPGCSIDKHYDNLSKDKKAYEYRKVTKGNRLNRKKQSLKNIIRDEQWDYISFQQASQLSGIASSFVNLGALKRLVMGYTTNLHVTYIWHMTWSYAEDFSDERFAPYDYNQRQMYSDIVSAMLNVLPGVGIKRIVPSGIAIQLGRYRLGNTMNRDGYHLSYTIGRFIAACTWCEFLTGKSVDGNSYRPDALTEEEVITCQQIAHEACYMQQRGSYTVF